MAQRKDQTTSMVTKLPLELRTITPHESLAKYVLPQGIGKLNDQITTRVTKLLMEIPLDAEINKNLTFRGVTLSPPLVYIIICPGSVAPEGIGRLLGSLHAVPP